MKSRIRLMVVAAVAGCALLVTSFAASAEKKAAPAAPAAATAPAPAAPAAEAPAGQYKIGVVTLKDVFKNYNKVKTQYAALEAEVKKRQEGIDVLSKKIEDAKAQYDKEKDTMSPQDRAQREDSIQKDFREYTIELKKNQDDIDAKEQLIFKENAPEIQQAVKTIGEEQGYHVILNSSAIVYSSPTIDMTQKVVDLLNSGSASAGASSK